jgi:hypothetical protein
VIRHLLRDFKLAAVFQTLCDLGRAEGAVPIRVGISAARTRRYITPGMRLWFIGLVEAQY